MAACVLARVLRVLRVRALVLVRVLRHARVLLRALVLVRVLRVLRVLVLGASRRSTLYVCCVRVCVDTCCVLGSPQLLATPGHHQCVYL